MGFTTTLSIWPEAHAVELAGGRHSLAPSAHPRLPAVLPRVPGKIREHPLEIPWKFMGKPVNTGETHGFTGDFFP